MPKWRRSLSDEDMLYLVAYLKTLPIDSEVASKKLEVSEFGQIEDPKKLDQNYRFIEEMNHSPFGEERPYYGGGRGE
jgi:hypothetical protein